VGRIVGVANLKGGTGKSTIAVNLACLAARETGPVLLVDADPQGTAAAWLDPGAVPAGLTVEAWPVPDDPAPWADRILAAAAAHGRIIVDLPPHDGPGFSSALLLVDALVIPVTPSAIDLRATAKTLQRIKQVQRSRGGRPACLLVPNRVDQRTALGRAVRQSLRDLDLEVAPSVGQRAQHAMAFAAHQWIGAHAPGSPALREMSAVAAKLDALLEAAPVSDDKARAVYPLSELQLKSTDELVATHGLPPADDDAAAAAHRRAVENAPLPACLMRADSVEPPTSPSGDATIANRRQGWLASLIAGMRMLCRPHAG
jgi:chromosome partitioning protein